MKTKLTLVVAILLLFSLNNSLAQVNKVSNFYSELTSSTFPGKKIKTIAQDKDGEMWFGTMYGVAMFDGQKWINYTKQGIKLGDVNAIAIDSKGTKWFGTKAGIFYI